MVETNNEDGNNTLLDNIKYTKNNYEKICNFYESQLINYLIDNSNSYPLWCSNDDGICPKTIKNNYNCSIYLG